MVSMVTFTENTEHIKTSPRTRGQDRSCKLRALRCSKLSPQAALRETAPQNDAQLGSCSRDPNWVCRWLEPVRDLRELKRG